MTGRIVPLRFVRVVTAGICDECTDPIQAGDMMVLHSDDSYAHATHYRSHTILRWEHETNG